jgi:serine protease inhibitor
MIKKILIFSLLISFITFTQSIASETKKRFTNNDANFYFTSLFLKTTFEEKKDNFVISPLSVYTVTTLLANGTDGNSTTELENILNPKKHPFMPSRPINIEKLNTNLSKYITQKNKTIKITNTIAGNDFKPEYINKVQNELFAILDETKAETYKLKLVNEVDFNDEWLSPFNINNTSTKEFYSLDGSTDLVDMMHENMRLVDYYQDEKMQAIRLPYKDENFMHIFLPKENVNFNKFVQDLSAENLYLDYKPIPTELFIPKFQFDYNIPDMITFFKKWEINDIFDINTANLTQLTNFKYYVSEIIHKAKIKTDETGTEAHASTTIILSKALLAQKTLEPKKWKMTFNANRPFIFMINNGDFIGIYSKGIRFDKEKKLDTTKVSSSTPLP